MEGGAWRRREDRISEEDGARYSAIRFWTRVWQPLSPGLPAMTVRRLRAAFSRYPVLEDTPSCRATGVSSSSGAYPSGSRLVWRSNNALQLKT
ncbi:hypothetical protein MRX96_033319 [Rhipicephalus microplus]